MEISKEVYCGGTAQRGLHRAQLEALGGCRSGPAAGRATGAARVLRASRRATGLQAMLAK